MNGFVVDSGANTTGMDRAVDWRFFLPISAGRRILVVGSDCQEYVHFFKTLDVLSVDLMTDPAAILETGIVTPTFDMIIAPQGLALDDTSGKGNWHLPLYEKLAGMLVAQGLLFIGFLNASRPGNRTALNGYVTSPKAMRRILVNARFVEVNFLGLTGNPLKPDYILPLKGDAIGFVLHHKYRHKIPAGFGSLFFHPLITRFFSIFFGAYFVTAVVPGKLDDQKVQTEVYSFNDHLTEYIADKFAYDAASINWVLLSNGGADLHDSVILFCMVNEQRTPQFVAKVPRLPENHWALQAEYDSLTLLWDLLGEIAVQRLPRPVSLFKFENQSALIISYLPGENLLRASNGAFWRNKDQVQTLFVDAAMSLREIFDASRTPLAGSEYPSSDFSQKVERFKELYPLNSQQLEIIASLPDRLALDASRATHKVFIQGDFWHGNIIRGLEHGKLMFVDWQYARWTTDVSLDVFLFLLAAALSATPDAPAEQRASSAVDVLLNWMPAVIPSYLAVFRESNSYSMLPTCDGMLLCCVEKAVRAGMDFGHAQQDDVIWWWIFDALTKKWPGEN
jgi:hypothetical protein